MNLAFSEKFKHNKQITYFISRIWQGLTLNKICSYSDLQRYSEDYGEQFSKGWEECTSSEMQPKIHSIRKGERWTDQHNIHFIINSRSINRFQFAPVVPVVSVQKIQMYWSNENFCDVFIDSGSISCRYSNNNDHINYELLLQLAKNDGFNSVKDFFEYFNEDFDGQLIHWTNLKY